MSDGQISSSFRDPSGFVFLRDGEIYRQVNASYRQHYDHLMRSGLYQDLVNRGLLLPHTELPEFLPEALGVYKVLKPEPVHFVSYPYEWCFSQLKDAALTTLAIQKQALEHGATLKDASAYNIQFVEGKPRLIDTLSFEKYQEGEPWVAYKQFCEHFLAPLALMSYRDVRLSQLAITNLDGIPLGLAKALLPIRTKFRFSLLFHIHLHASAQKKYAEEPKSATRRRGKFSHRAFLGMLDSLETGVRNLKANKLQSNWADYYQDYSYLPETFEHKKELVASFLKQENPVEVWDLGANTGVFSRIASQMGIRTISFDNDPAVIEKSYLYSVEQEETKILPLVCDLVNPTPSIGWANKERMSMQERGPVDMAFVLALIHHLSITNNVPLKMVAEFFAQICRLLVIEFVPKSDSQVQRLLRSREDIFPEYTQQAFEQTFGSFFNIRSCTKLRGSDRVLYLMEAN